MRVRVRVSVVRTPTLPRRVAAVVGVAQRLCGVCSPAVRRTQTPAASQSQYVTLVRAVVREVSAAVTVAVRRRQTLSTTTVTTVMTAHHHLAAQLASGCRSTWQSSEPPRSSAVQFFL
jgi:hypothetical protein